jgi:hypothetical protein
MVKITNILIFYKLKIYIKKQIKKSYLRLVYSSIQSYYYTKLKGKNLIYLLKSENYIKFMLNQKSGKSAWLNFFLKKWFYLKVNEWT